MGLPRIRNNIYEICVSLFVLCLIIPVISGKLNLKHTFLKIYRTKFWRTHGSALYDAVKCRLFRTMRITYAKPDILHILIGYTLLVPMDDDVALAVCWYSCAIVDLIIKYFYHDSTNRIVSLLCVQTNLYPNNLMLDILPYFSISSIITVIFSSKVVDFFANVLKNHCKCLLSYHVLYDCGIF